MAPPSTSTPSTGERETFSWPGARLWERYGPGLLLTGTIALAASFVSEHLGGPVMLYALLFGIAFHFLSTDKACAPGVMFSAKSVLRFGVALLGVRITLGEVAALGMPTVSLIVLGVAFTLLSGWAIGRALGLRSDHAILSAGAVAICGASAALAISTVLPRHANAERQTIMTVVGVTALSTVAMVLYPILAQSLGLSDKAAGIFIGATIHDVAQVVGAGYMISDEAGETAAIVKLMRVACLVPVVIGIGLLFSRQAKEAGEADDTSSVPLLPTFLVAFVLIMVANSIGLIPAPVAEFGSQVSRWALIMAVAALGVKTSLKEVFSMGAAPITVLSAQTVALAVFALIGLTFFVMSV